jgi:hypothetical protein
MEETIITWNATNWITVVVMVALGFLILAVISQLYHNMRGKSAAASGE